ncbi:MAG TPA: Hsp20/alpha crystallin family protein [Polyangiales bacterium]|nr:Hsp20/alpha crystallin family protein [Polyangiales bacterium]
MNAQPNTPVRELLPRVDVYENADELLLLADVPGVTPESVNVRYEADELRLEAQRTAADGPKLRYFRAFALPDTIDPERITAELKQGVLHVHLGKVEKAKPRTIAIRSE